MSMRTRSRDIAQEFVGVAREAGRHLWPASVAERFGILAVLLVAAIVRWMFIREPIRFDEASNALYYADRSILHALFGSAGNENHALNSVMMWFSVRIFGWTEISARLPVFFAGLAFVWAQYGFLRWYLRNPRIALIGAGFAAASPWLVYFSVNGRGYVGGAVVVTGLLAIVLSALRESRLERAVALGFWFGLFAVCGAFCVRAMVMFAVTGIVAFVPSLRSGPSSGSHNVRPGFLFVAAAVVSSVLLGLVVFGPRLGYMGFLSVESVLGSNGQGPLLDDLWTTASGFAVVPVLLLGGIREAGWTLVLISGLIGGGLLQDWRRQRAMLGWIGIFLLCALAATLVLRFGIPNRVFVPASALFLPVIASAFRILDRPARKVLPLIAAAFVMIGYPAYWIGHGFFERMRYTGYIPEARPVAKFLLQYDALPKSLLVIAPLYDNGVAFYFREAGATRKNFASGYLKAREVTDFCGFSQAVVYNPAPTGGRNDLGQSLSRFSKEAWYPRLRLNQSSIIWSKDLLGEVTRVALAERSGNNNAGLTYSSHSFR